MVFPRGGARLQDSAASCERMTFGMTREEVAEGNHRATTFVVANRPTRSTSDALTAARLPHWLVGNHITPLSPDWRVKQEAAELRSLTDEFLTADGKWKK